MKTPLPKVIAVLLGLPLLIAVADWAWTQGPQNKYSTNGVSAYYTIEESFEDMIGTFNTYGYRRAYVEISEGAEAMATGGVSGRYFWLNFDISVYGSSGYGVAYGSGPISAEYVTSSRPATQNLSLKVDTNLLEPPFYMYQYGDILVQFPNIDLTWKRTSNDWYRWEGHQVLEMGDLVEHIQGSGVRYYTIPTGTITLPDIPSPVQWTYANGWLASQKGWNILIWRTPGP